MPYIYIVEYAYGRIMGQQFATDARGIEAIVETHYCKMYGYDPPNITVNMEDLTVTVTQINYIKTCYILRFALDKIPL